MSWGFPSFFFNLLIKECEISMAFESCMETMIKESRNTDILFRKINIFTESCFRQYEIDIKTAELETLNESNDDKLITMIEEAHDGLVNRIQNSVQKAYNALIAFFGTIVEKVKEMFCTEKGKKTLNELDKLSKNPKAKSIRIQSMDVESAMRAADVSQGRIQRLFLRVKSGRVTDEQMKELDAINQSYESERGKAMKTTAITISIASALAIVGKTVKTLSDRKKIETESKIIQEKFNFSKEDSELLAKIERTVNANYSIARRKINDMLSGLNHIYHTVIKREYLVEDPFKDKDVKESTEDSSIQEYDDGVNEIVEINITESEVYLRNLEEEIFESSVIDKRQQKIEKVIEESEIDELLQSLTLDDIPVMKESTSLNFDDQLDVDQLIEDEEIDI